MVILSQSFSCAGAISLRIEETDFSATRDGISSWLKDCPKRYQTEMEREMREAEQNSQHRGGASSSTKSPTKKNSTSQSSLHKKTSINRNSASQSSLLRFKSSSNSRKGQSSGGGKSPKNSFKGKPLVHIS